jgi:predicted Zn-dependent peptidase
MADLDAASLADVKKWFISRYGPNNAVISLAGDISVDEAKALMNKYFGGISRGAVNNPAEADVPTLAAPKTIVMKDRVAAVELQRHWAVPGLLSNDLPALDLGASVLGGLASSRLDRILVREEKLAVAVSASLQPFHRVSLMEISATVKPGVDPAVVDKRLDEIMAQFLSEGPTADELQRAATAEVAGRIRGLEKVGDGGGKASALAQSELYAHDSDFYKKQLAAYAAVTPDQVRAEMSQWLSRPVLKVVLEPGDRAPYEEAKGPPRKRAADIKVASVKRDMPPVGQPVALDFPTIEHITLSNGIKVSYAQRSAIPLTSVALSFDAGYASDPVAKRGLQSMTMNLLDEGAAGMSAQAIAEQSERLGARIATGGSADRSTVSLGALTANLEPSLKLMTDIVTRPDFTPTDIDRLRTQTVTAIAQAKTSPGSIAVRALPALLYGPDHPYGTTAAGDEAAVKGFTRDDFVAFQQSWLRPDNAELYIVSDLPLAQLTPILEGAFGSWQAPAAPRGTKNFGAIPAHPAKPRIVLIDRPGSPQSFIYAGEITPIDPRADNTALFAGSDVLGGSSASRIFADLREAKGWSYGAYGSPAPTARTVPYIIQAPVQADRTGDSVAALMGHLKDIVGPKSVTSEELARSVASSVGELPGRFETGAAVLGAMQSNALFGRPDNYYETVAGRYEALTIPVVDQALRQAIDPNGFVFVVVGDAAKVKPQLDKLGLPVEVSAAR